MSSLRLWYPRVECPATPCSLPSRWPRTRRRRLRRSRRACSPAGRNFPSNSCASPERARLPGGGEHLRGGAGNAVELLRSNIGDVGDHGPIHRHQERIRRGGVQVVNTCGDILRSLGEKRQRDFEMCGAIEILKPFLGAFAGDDHHDGFEIPGLVLHIQIVELDNLFRRGIGSIAEEREDVGRLIEIADVTDTLTLIGPRDIRNGNGLRGGADGEAGSNLSRKPGGAEQSRADDGQLAYKPAENSDTRHFATFASSLLSVLYFRSSHLNQPPLRTFTLR